MKPESESVAILRLSDAISAETATLCSICPDPGHCCREFPLSVGFRKGASFEEVEAWLQGETHEAVPFFVPLGESDLEDCDDPEKRLWLFTCTKVSAEGRCTIYEDRPGLCRRFTPRGEHQNLKDRPDIEPICCFTRIWESGLVHIASAEPAQGCAGVPCEEKK